MTVYDRVLKLKVDVREKNCLKKSCYWPRPDPGIFQQGRGYRTRPGKSIWLCGTREIHGCPMKKENGKMEVTNASKKFNTGAPRTRED